MDNNNRLKQKPFLIDAQKAHDEKIVTYTTEGEVLIKIPEDAEPIRVPKHQQYDLTQGTIFGLNERLTSTATSPKMVDTGNKTLRDLFNDEWKKYEDALDDESGFHYGTYAYYKKRNELVRYAPSFWHRVVATASSSMLLTDPAYAKRWVEVRNILSKTTLAVAGASVGNNAIHAAVMDLRPEHVKIADKSRYKMENINRVRLNYADLVESNALRTDPTQSLLRNKAVVTAEQIYAIDPFINVFTYENGIDEADIKHFFDGDDNNEPPADMIIEEVDDPRIKILLREEARKRRIPLLMVSDLGSSIQLDISRYDKDENLPLTHGTDDVELKESMEEVYRHPGERKKFFSFVDQLIGSDYRSDELARIIDNTMEIPTSTIIPQLGSTAMVAGGIMAETIARIRLGHDYPTRVFFNKKTFEVRAYGK